MGTEPYWNVEVEVGKQIVFTSIAGIDSMTFNYVEPVTSSDGSLLFKTKSKDGSIELRFKREQCSDGMSDDEFYYSSSLKIEQKSTNTKLELNGCGKYVKPTALNDLWVLTELKGKKIDATKIPTMELHLSTYKAMGNAGCNNYQGSFSLKRDLIEFNRNFISTRMYCENQAIESAFLEAFVGNRFVYEVANNQLVLKTEGHPILVFKKVD
ncbi:MAG: META domain-containing protein [Cyclobacteriaceae bacterium]|nr:META domain-containing protein [Cyclobacteriaceae bacterium]